MYRHLVAACKIWLGDRGQGDEKYPITGAIRYFIHKLMKALLFKVLLFNKLHKSERTKGSYEITVRLGGCSAVKDIHKVVPSNK